jgi:hypothetical protein
MRADGSPATQPAEAETLPPLFAGGPNCSLVIGNGEKATDLQRHAEAARIRFRLTPRILGSYDSNFRDSR